MSTPTLESAGNLAPIVPGYSVSGRCWEDAISITFAGLDNSNGRPVYLRMNRLRRADAGGRSPLRRDFEICGKARCNVISKPTDFVKLDDAEYLVIANDGTIPLAEILLQRRPSFVQSLEALVNIANALGELHQQSIVHCNLSPRSIWADNELRKVRLTDLSRATLDNELSSERHANTDFHYLAPEQTGRMARAVDARADLYSLGAVGYHLLCGRPPFDDTEPLALIHAHLAQTPTPAHVPNPEIPEAVSSILTKLLSKAPEERYQTAEGLKSDLDECLNQWRAHGSVGDIQVGLADASSIFRISNKLYGRDAERAALQAAFNRTKNGTVELVHISGPPGIGKSLLAQSLQPLARTCGAFVSGKSDQYKQNEPYSVIAQAFGILIEQLLCSSPDAVREWGSRVIEAVGLNANLIADVIPALAHLISRRASTSELSTTEKRHRFNHAFRQFVKVFSNGDHPLCMFLDDIQWADPASLALIQSLLTDKELSHLLVVVACRTNEDDGSDIFTGHVDELARLKVPITRISPSQLDVDQICELLRDTLDCSEREAAPLAALVKTKTDGNPFFLSQFLSFLNHQKLVVFDFAQGRWVWDLRKISEEGITDNVLELMHRKLANVPDLVQSAMRVASCIGNRFSASTLSLVMQEPLVSVLEVLRIAGREGLIIQIDESEERAEFKFLHDRLQQAAYALIPDTSRAVVRLQIGRRLLAALPKAERDAASFIVLDNLNSAMHLITDRAETESLARLNAYAGRRAREIAAFSAALGYFSSGIKLIQPDGWNRHYELTLDLHLGCFECAYVLGHVEEANDLFVAILENSAAAIDKAKAYYLKILLSTGMDRSEDAVTIGREALRLFDEYLPETPTKLQLFRELTAVILRLRRRPASELINLPKMTDSSTEAVVTLLMSICPAAYFRNPDLMVFAALRIMNISLRHGNSRASSFGYVLYGLARGALFGDYKGGHEFGRLAVELAKSNADPNQQCKIITIFSGWLNFWREPVDESVKLLRSSLRLALDAGDIQYAHYAVLQIIFLRSARGVTLDELMNDVNQYQPIIERAADWFTQTTFGFRRQCILELQNRKGGWSNNSESSLFDQDSMLPILRGAGNLTALTYYLVAKAQLAYLLGSISDARRYSDAADAEIKTIVNQVIVVEHYFCRGLISAALIRQGGADGATNWSTLRRCRARLSRYAMNCPSNFASHLRLLQAETASLSGRSETAALLFDEAIRLACEQKFHQIEALANELAGQSYLACNRDHVARMYLLAARKSYLQWGAFAKVNQLARKFAAILPVVVDTEVPIDATTRPRSEKRTDIIDVDTVMRATMTLSADLESDRLLGKLMRLILECMGGERAFIVSKRASVLRIEAAGFSDGAQVRLDLGSGPSGGSQFSESVVNYVLHTGREIVLDDAKADVRFQTCPHISENSARSIACVPITKMGSMDGVAYVESSLSGTFSDDRVRGLVLLSQQALAAVENRQLQTKLDKNNETLKLALQNVELLSGIRSHLAKFVPKSVQRLIEDNPTAPDLATREQDITVMFLDVAGSTSMSKQFGSEELKHIIETYFSSFADDIFRNGGEINEVAGDGLMIVFQHSDPGEHARLATRSAISIREKTSALNDRSGGQWPHVVINIGIHSGTALLGANKIESAAETLWVYTATGYSVNVAARIGSAASNGAILVSETTASRLGSEFNLVARGQQAFKGVSELIGVYSVEGKEGGATAEVRSA